MLRLTSVAREVFDLLFVDLVCGLLVLIEVSPSRDEWEIYLGRIVLSGGWMSDWVYTVIHVTADSFKAYVVLGPPGLSDSSTVFG
jgi:uncharacterized membrane protein